MNFHREEERDNSRVVREKTANTPRMNSSSSFDPSSLREKIRRDRTDNENFADTFKDKIDQDFNVIRRRIESDYNTYMQNVEEVCLTYPDIPIITESQNGDLSFLVFLHWENGPHIISSEKEDEFIAVSYIRGGYGRTTSRCTFNPAMERVDMTVRKPVVGDGPLFGEKVINIHLGEEAEYDENDTTITIPSREEPDDMNVHRNKDGFVVLNEDNYDEDLYHETREIHTFAGQPYLVKSFYRKPCKNVVIRNLHTGESKRYVFKIDSSKEAWIQYIMYRDELYYTLSSRRGAFSYFTVVSCATGKGSATVEGKIHSIVCTRDNFFISTEEGHLVVGRSLATLA